MTTGKIDTTVLRLPTGMSVRKLDARMRDKGFAGPDFEFAPTTSAPEIDLDAVRVDRVDASDAERRQLGAEEETLGVIDTMFFERIPSAAPASTAGGGGAVTTAWGRRAIGLTDAPAFTGDGVVVAVLDTGIAAGYETHPAFQGMDIEAENFTSSDATAWADDDGHGTHCAGTIFGQPVGGTKIGVAPGIKKALIGKVLGKNGGSTDSVYRGILWAAQNRADVISMSLAIDFDSLRRRHIDVFGRSDAEATSLTLKSYRENFKLFDTLSVLFAMGGTRVKSPVVVVATGNESARPDYTIEAAPPAVAEWFLSVNAVDQALTVAPFSNTGGKLSAPGVDILSADLNNGLRTDSGTSMAAPHVAGAAALWIEKMTEGGAIAGRTVQDHMLRVAAPLTPANGAAEDLGDGLVQVPT